MSADQQIGGEMARKKINFFFNPLTAPCTAVPDWSSNGLQSTPIRLLWPTKSAWL